MGKQLGIVLMGGILLATACGGRQSAATRTAYTEPTRTVYTCSGEALVLVDEHGRSVLMDANRVTGIEPGWTDDDGDHFLSFERVGEDRRQVAYEYTVPRQRDRAVTVRVYDRSAGAHFKVTAHPRTWKIHGEPSSESTCSPEGPAIAAGGQR